MFLLSPPTASSSCAVPTLVGGGGRWCLALPPPLPPAPPPPCESCTTHSCMRCHLRLASIRLQGWGRGGCVRGGGAHVLEGVGSTLLYAKIDMGALQFAAGVAGWKRGGSGVWKGHSGAWQAPAGQTERQVSLQPTGCGLVQSRTLNAHTQRM